MKYPICDICNKRHKEIDDIYHLQSHYLTYNPTNKLVEIWDVKKKKWVKQEPVSNKSKTS